MQLPPFQPFSQELKIFLIQNNDDALNYRWNIRLYSCSFAVAFFKSILVIIDKAMLMLPMLFVESVVKIYHNIPSSSCSKWMPVGF